MRHLPNALTLANLFCGACALMYTVYGQPETAALFTAGCFLFDYLDGMTARALRISSPLGKELDSLADVVSFGVVPGAMLYQLLAGSCSPADTAVVQTPALPAFVLSAFSALRLGRFNLDSRQTRYFIGLSTPACTVFVLGLTLAAHHDRFGLAAPLSNPWFLYGLIALLSWLLNSNVPMFGMKINRFDRAGNSIILGFLALFAILLFFCKELALSAIILCYIAASVVWKNKVVSS